MQILVPDLGPHVVLNFLMMDYDMIGNDEKMAEYDVSLDKADEDADFLRDSSESFPKTLVLRPVRKRGSTPSSKSHGELKVSLQFTPFFNADAPEAGAEEDPAKVMEALAVRTLLCFCAGEPRRRSGVSVCTFPACMENIPCSMYPLRWRAAVVGERSDIRTMPAHALCRECCEVPAACLRCLDRLSIGDAGSVSA